MTETVSIETRVANITAAVQRWQQKEANSTRRPAVWITSDNSVAGTQQLGDAAKGLGFTVIEGEMTLVDVNFEDRDDTPLTKDFVYISADPDDAEYDDPGEIAAHIYG